jgi:probable HAF family extracellular repeat protein
MPCKVIRAAGAVFALSLAFAPMDSDAQTNLVDLGKQTGTGAPVALNNSGQIAFTTGLYSNGTLTPLGALPGSNINAVATGINAVGQLIGNVSANGTAIPGVCANPQTIPVLFANGTLSPLLAALDCALITPRATVTGINASGQAVGYGAYGPEETTYTWVLTNGTLTTLAPPSSQFGPPELGGLSNGASGISDNGFITGIVYNEIPLVTEEDAFLYSSGAWTDVGQGAGSAVNSNGQVTGYLVVNGQNHAFLYGAGVTTDLNSWLNATSSQGNAINATGQLVGNSTNGGGSGFFYNGTVTDLNALVSASDPLKARVTLTAAVALNDNRLILASGTDSQDMSLHSYLVQGPWLDFAPGILDFASEAIGTVSADQSVTVKNSGTTTVQVGSVMVSGDFVIHANDCDTSLQAGGTCTIGVAFASSGSGDRTGGLTVASNGAPFVVPLLGASPISVTFTASPTSVPMGSPAKLTWKISSGASCTATGGVNGDGWTGTFSSSGSQTVTYAAPTSITYGLTCTAGSQTAQASAVVIYTALPVSVSVSASPTSFTAGRSITITWQSTNATSCAGNGGGSSDGWPGAKATSGSQTITEPYAPAGSTLSLKFTVACTSSISSLSNSASVTVVENAVPSKGGGGGLDAITLISLFLLLLTRFRLEIAWRSRRVSG